MWLSDNLLKTLQIKGISKVKGIYILFLLGNETNEHILNLMYQNSDYSYKLKTSVQKLLYGMHKLKRKDFIKWLV